MSPATYSDLPQTSFAILRMLSFAPMSGYELKQYADKSIGHFYWSPAKSQIYAELRRLRDAGLASEEHVEQENRPDKRVYAITEAGRAKLADWINNAEFEQDVFKSTLMLRLFFGKAGSPESLLRLLRENLELVNQHLSELEAMERECLDAGDDYDATYSLITIRAGLHLHRATVEWSHESIKSLEKQIASRLGGSKPA